MRRLLKILAAIFLLLLLTGNYSQAIDSAANIKIDVKEFTLDNGMLFLVVERPTTPQISLRLAIRAGSALEKTGRTGIAHMLEHMLFKGTKNFGSLDFKEDARLQAQIESAYQVILREKLKRNPDHQLIQNKILEMEKLRHEAHKIFVPQAFSAQLGKNGAVGVNAFTTKDQTQYIMSIPSDMLEQWFSIVSEQLFEPSWRKFYVEREVIQREWAYRYINNPNGAAWLDLDATAYNAHPYRNPVIGWKADMEKFSTKDAIEFHQKFYQPANTVCVLVGDVRVEQAKKLARIYFQRYPAGKRAPEKVTAEPPQQGPRKSIRFQKGARTPLVRISYHSAPMETEDFYALDALTMILSQGRGARMARNIINKGLAVEAWAYHPDNRYGSRVLLGGSPNEPDSYHKLAEKDKRRAYQKDCEKLEQLLLSEVEKLKTERVAPREIERILKLNQREFLERLRSNEALAGSLATLEVQVGWRYLTAYLEKISQVTPEDIQRVAKKYIKKELQTSIYIIPGGTPDQLPESFSEIRSLSASAAAGLAAPQNLTNHSVYPTPEGWKHPLSFARVPTKISYPPAEKLKIDSTTVFYLSDPELPLVDLTILIKAGAVDIPAAKTGLNQILTNCLIRGGTEKYSPSELALALDENAIEISVSVHKEETVINLSVMKSDWEKGLAFLEEILTRPRFDPKVFDVVKQQALISLKRTGEKARIVSMREAMTWHFPDHPYGRNPLDGLKTIPTITRQDLQGFISTYFVPSNMVVAIAGDISKDNMISGIQNLFKKFPRKKAPAREIKDPSENGPMITLIHKPGQVQSQVSLLLRGVRRTNPDYWKTSLLMGIFGGSDSLLYTRLRDDLGIVYAAGFYQTYRWKAGILVGYIGCKSDRTSESIAETIHIMRALQKEVAQENFELKRLDNLNSFVFNVDTPHDLVEVYARYYMRQEPLDTLDIIQKTFIRASRNELRLLAQKLLDPEKIQIVVVADKNTRVKVDGHPAVSLEENLNSLAEKMGLPFREVEWR